MAIRRRGSRWAVEVYDPTAASRKRYVGTFATQREARDAEREAEAEVARLRGKRNNETVASFAARWLDLRPRQKEATNRAYREQVKPFVERHGERRLRDVDIELAYEWLREKRWTHGGIRAMFSDARRMGLVEINPFAGLRLRGSRGRKDLAPLTVPQVDRLAGCAADVWSGEVALTMRALILTGAYVGMRPGEMYGLRWSDFDLRNDEIRVERQFSPASGRFELPKNGRTRVVVLTARPRLPCSTCRARSMPTRSCSAAGAVGR